MNNCVDDQVESKLSLMGRASAIVTGGAGAIGNNLVRELIRIGVDVVVIDDFSSGRLENLSDLEGVIHIIEGDIADPSILKRAFDRPVDYVFHLAALFANQNSVEHPVKDLHTNGLGTLRLLEKAVEFNVRRFIFASSSCVYGRCNEVISEKMEMAPDTPYAITKVLGEQYTHFFGINKGLSTVVIRYFNSYGPGELSGPFRNVIPNFFALAAEGKALPITGTGLETRDFTFVGDIVRGTMLAAVCPEVDGEVFNLGTGKETRINTLAEKINQITGNESGTVQVNKRTWDQVNRRKACIKKARTLLDYEPIISIDEGLQCYWSWYRKIAKHKNGLVTTI